MARQQSASSARLAVALLLSLVCISSAAQPFADTQTKKSEDGMNLVKLAAEAKLFDHKGQDIQLPLVFRNVVTKSDLRIFMFYHEMHLFFDNGRLTFYVRENHDEETYTIEKMDGQFYPGDYTQVYCSTGALNVTYPKKFRYSCTSEQTLTCYAKSNKTGALSDRKELAQIKFERLEFEVLNSDPNRANLFIRPPYPSSCFHEQSELSFPIQTGNGLVPSHDGTTIASSHVSAILHDPNGFPDSTLEMKLTIVEVFPDYRKDDGNHYVLALNYDTGRVLLMVYRAGRKFVITGMEGLFLPEEGRELNCISDELRVEFPTSKRYSCKTKQTIRCHKTYGRNPVAEVTFNDLEFDLVDADPEKSSQGQFTHKPFANSCRIG